MEKDCISVEELEEYTPEKKGSFKSWFRGLMLGGLIGAGVAMLATPRNGIQNRQMLRAKGIELRGKATDTLYQARAQANEVARKGTERANDLMQRGQSLIDERKRDVQSAVEGVKEGVRSYKEQNGGDMTDRSGMTGMQSGYTGQTSGTTEIDIE